MDKKLTGLISLFFLTFFVFISVVVFSKPLSRFTRAAEESRPSSSKSLIFAWPLSSSVSSAETVKVDVFVRSEKGSPIPKRQVLINSSLGTLNPKVIMSDDNGKASFSLKSETVGTAVVTATVDNSVPISQKVSVKFY
jgi:hypothetical protein